LIKDYLEKHKTISLSWLLKSVKVSRNAWYHKPKVIADNTLEVTAKIEEVLVESP